ncbi:MAG: hypothetical protein FWD73_14405 [Polyangiaceae bacterium]|nr:hypothetical protein [Polyangiaceae bacterium]
MPIPAPEAKKLIRRLLKEGTFVVCQHGRDEMNKDGLNDVDALNVLRAGTVQEAEWENGGWRHQVCTQRMTFVVAFDPDPASKVADDVNCDETELIVVTAWRAKR